MTLLQGATQFDHGAQNESYLASGGRMTARTGKLNGVDAMRGIAAILVMTVHASHSLSGPKDFGYQPFWSLFAVGRSGVDFFFVLSGFIITFVHMGEIEHERKTFWSFWKKRLLRIYPTYWIVAALYFALLLISPTPDRSEQKVGHAISSFFLLPEVASPVLGVGWSLRHELLFYLLFSTLFLDKRLGVAILAAWGALIAFSMTYQCETGNPFFNGIQGTIIFRGCNIEFFFGIATALVVRKQITWKPVAVAIIGGLGFLITGLWESFGVAPMHEWPLRTLAYAACAALALYGVATLDKAGNQVPVFAQRLGLASYSIYLTHVPVILLTEFALRLVSARISISAEVAFVMVVVIAAVAGIVFSELIEQPILRSARKYTRKIDSA